MCTWISEKAEIFGSGKGAQGWFPLQQAYVYYDHPFHASLEHAIIIDFVNHAQGPGARVAVEMSAESARELLRTIQAALETGERQHVAGEPQVAMPAGTG